MTGSAARLALLPAALLAGCMSSVAPDDPPSSAAVVQGQVEYTAETAILESFPVQLHTTVHMKNRARSAVGFAQCPNCERILFT